MMGTTHQQVGVAAAVASSAALHLPLSAAVVVVAGAARWGSTPDSMEHRFRAPHREWTHWLSTIVLTAVAPVAVLVVVAVLVGGLLQDGWQPARFDDYLAGVPVAWRAVQASARGQAWHGGVAEYVAGAAVLAGMLVAWARVIAMTMHTLADACTPYGSPLWGLPGIERSQRPVHITPYWLRIKTGSVDDTAIGFWALGASLLIVYLCLRGFELPHLQREVAGR